MPEFAKFQQNARELYMKIAQSYSASTGCISFLTSLVPLLMNDSALKDAATIGLMAESLSADEEKDRELKEFVQQIKNVTLDTKQLEQFKSQALTGMYLIIWCQYSSSVSSYVYTKLIELFQMDLNVESPTKMDKLQFQASLEALSQYCSYIFQKRHEGVFARLNQRLGESIQANIHEIRVSEGVIDNSWSTVFNGIMNSL